MNIVAVIPAYNEETRVRASIEDVRAFVDDVVVVDDASHDQTGTEALSAGAWLLTHLINRGQGAALQTGTDFAFQHLQADIVIHFDADGQMQAKDVPMMVQPIQDGEAEVVLGSRFLENTSNVPFIRRLVLWGGVWFTRVFSGVKVTDTHNGFRALSATAGKKMRITMDRMAHASELLDLLVVHQLPYVERPVTIRYSQESLEKGQSSLGAIKIVKDLVRSKFIDL
jgi:glycosyltransferase involved in cell wall biosynthesis